MIKEFSFKEANVKVYECMRYISVKKVEFDGANSHNIAELEPCLNEGAALVVAGGDGSSSSGSVSGHRFQLRPATVGGPGCGTISGEAHTSTHQRIAATPTRGHVSTSHATQHPERNNELIKSELARIRAP